MGYAWRGHLQLTFWARTTQGEHQGRHICLVDGLHDVWGRGFAQDACQLFHIVPRASSAVLPRRMLLASKRPMLTPDASSPGPSCSVL